MEPRILLPESPPPDSWPIDETECELADVESRLPPEEGEQV